VRLAQLACAVGLLYTAVSVYWGVGGTWLLDTVGGSLARLGRQRDAGVLLALWVAVVLKVAASLFPLLAVRHRTGRARNRRLWLVAWTGAVILTAYGLVLTAVGLLIQAGIVPRSAGADRRALAWHAYLWDPWFLLWGLLIIASLVQARSCDRRDTTAGSRARRNAARQGRG
jgi:hypothetical protein